MRRRACGRSIRAYRRQTCTACAVAKRRAYLRAYRETARIEQQFARQTMDGDRTRWVSSR
jgi:hypothetical protein